MNRKRPACHFSDAVSVSLTTTVGARFDYENKKANLNTFYSPPVLPATVVDAEKSFSNVSPQFAISYHATPEAMVYR